VSRSKSERIENKMGEAQFGLKENKKRVVKGLCGWDEWENTVALAKVYSCFFARARDLLRRYLFFYY
jgi:hypothetical protein